MNKHIQELIKLFTENPDMEIITMTGWEVCGDDEHNYWLGEISRIRVDYVYQDDEATYLGDDIVEHFEYILEDDLTIAEEDICKKAEEMFEDYLKSGKVKKKIIIYIDV